MTKRRTDIATQCCSMAREENNIFPRTIRPTALQKKGFGALFSAKNQQRINVYKGWEN